jgi:hypothetical protein
MIPWSDKELVAVSK